MCITSIYSAVRGSKKKINQDYCLKLRNDGANFNAIIVADGMGSSYNSHEASKFVVQKMHDYLMRLSDILDLDFKSIFTKISIELNARVGKETENEIPDNSYGTTLICTVENKEKIITAYLGNGGILHVKGNFTDFHPDIYHLPWCLVNYLNPHTVTENGKEALFRYFSYKGSKQQIEPTIVEFSKDLNEYGDIVVICTDGIFSNDQLMVGRDNEQIWIEGRKSVALLLSILQEFFNKETIGDSAELEYTLEGYLKKLEESEGEMTDDCSLGVIITEQVFIHQKKLAGCK